MRFNMRTEVAIIGAGVVGTTIARELSRYEVDVTVVEREVDVAFGSPTKANSGIVHAGYDDEPGTARAKHCSRGNELWHKVAPEVGAPFKETGSLVVAFTEGEVEILWELRRRGEKNGVPGLEVVDDEALLRRIEPRLSDKVIAALRAPTAAVTSPYELAIAMMENAMKNGAKALFGAEVRGITVRDGGVGELQTSRGDVEVTYVINAGGLRADEISAMVGLDCFTIRPRRGEYYVLDKKQGEVTRHVVFPTPSQISKGIVVAPTVEGNVLMGPNAQDIDDKEDTATTATGLREAFEGAVKLFPMLADGKRFVIANFSGLRPEPNTKDFVIGSSDEVRGFVNAAGMRSPGLTAAPSVALEIVGLLRGLGLALRPRLDFNPFRKPMDRPMREMARCEAQALIQRNRRYGHVVCRCEHVTEGEILDAVQRGASTIDGIKFRTRAGMGRCQGGFCTPHVLRILASQLKIPVEEVTKKGGGSAVLTCRVKEMLRRGGLDG